jgi:hypothetical protein
VHREGILRDDDGDGRVTITLPRALPPHSVWVAVDLTNGTWVAGAPPGRPDRHVAFPEAAALLGTGTAATIEDRRELVAFMVARPGVGAWARTCGDGAEGDADHASDGRLRATVAELRPVGGSGAAPAALATGDVVVGMDLDTLEYWVGRAGVGR